MTDINQRYIETGIDRAGHGWVGAIPRLNTYILDRLRYLSVLPATEIMYVGNPEREEPPHSELIIFSKLSSADSRAITLTYARAAARVIEEYGFEVNINEEVSDFSEVDGLFEDPFFATLTEPVEPDRTNTFESSQSIGDSQESTGPEINAGTQYNPHDPRLFREFTDSQGIVTEVPKLLTDHEAAEILGISTKTIREHIREGKIKCIILPSSGEPVYRIPAPVIASIIGDNPMSLDEFYRYLEH